MPWTLRLKGKSHMDRLWQPNLYIAAGVVLGFGGGWLFYRLWRALLPRSRGRVFWQNLPESVRGMLTSDEPSELLRHYRTLLLSTANYAGRNLLAVLVAIAPITAIFLALTVMDLSGHVATRFQIHPATVIAPPVRLLNGWRMDNHRLLIHRDELRDSTVRLAGQTLNRDTLARKHAFCETAVSCLLFDMMLFETHRVDPETSKMRGSVVLRPLLLNGNPLWPYLNDFDFWFFISVMMGSTTAALRSRHHRAQE
jgi:hypothetical protein